jgi:hypothetical protein
MVIHNSALIVFLLQLLDDECFGHRLQEDADVAHLDHAPFQIDLLPREPELDVFHCVALHLEKNIVRKKCPIKQHQSMERGNPLPEILFHWVRVDRIHILLE